MEQNLTPGRYFRTTLHNPYGTKPIIDVQALADCLPHGSGIDGNWEIAVRKNGSLRVSGDFHRMDEYGSYCGWQSFSFTVTRASADQIHPLHGPCLGKAQVIHRKGDLLLSGVRGARDLNDYLSELIDYAVKEAGLVPSLRYDLIDLPTVEA